MDRTVCWNEYSPSGGIIVEKPESWCIETQKLYIASKQYNYESDQIALEDFMTCNWAWFKEEN